MQKAMLINVKNHCNPSTILTYKRAQFFYHLICICKNERDLRVVFHFSKIKTRSTTFSVIAVTEISILSLFVRPKMSFVDSLPKKNGNMSSITKFPAHISSEKKRLAERYI